MCKRVNFVPAMIAALYDGPEYDANFGRDEKCDNDRVYVAETPFATVAGVIHHEER